MGRRGRRREGENPRCRLGSAGAAIVLVIVGAIVASAPLMLELVASARQEQVVSEAKDACSAQGDRELNAAWKQARAYNHVLASGKPLKGVRRVLPYREQLAHGTWPCIGFVEVPAAGVRLPIYHGTADASLSQGAGHVEGTSLPVGGKGSNCCISAHSGLATARMFDGLREVACGDLVLLHTLGRELAYRVDGVEVVDDADTSSLQIEAGADKVTLITCTSGPLPGMPRGGYGVNDRRLVVTATRCTLPRDSEEMSARVPAGPRSLGAAISLVAAVMAALAVSARRKRSGGENPTEDKETER